VPGAADSILRTLEAFGLLWDGPVWRQSERDDAYEAALARLAAQHLTYACSCSRAELAGNEAADGRYPGRCRAAPGRARGPFATRFRVEEPGTVTVTDRLQPPLAQSVAATVGDFIVRRRDGFYAYQLAVVVDDAAQGITDVVRGLDLYDNTPRQVLLQQALGLPRPAYLHLPLVVDAAGAKLSKSDGAPAVEPPAVAAALRQVLHWLGLRPPAVLHGAPPQEQLAWAIGAWNPDQIQGVTRVSSAP